MRNALIAASYPISQEHQLSCLPCFPRGEGDTAEKRYPDDGDAVLTHGRWRDYGAGELARDLRKFVRPDLVAFGQHHRTKHRILELAHVAGPILLLRLKKGHGFSRERGLWRA